MHYCTLWFNPVIQEEGDEEMAERVDCGEVITTEELDWLLDKAKSRKSPGIDNLNVGLLKYGSALIKNKLLQLFNNMWCNHRMSKDWEIVLVINICKKGPKNNCSN
jgi:hypothetical protein